MKHKLIMVEGIPGSGKTTFAKKIAARLRDLGYNATCYNESDIHPADLSWIAVLTAAQYEQLLQKWPAYADQIRAQAWQESNRILVAYSNVEVTRKEDNALYDDFAPYEVYDGKWSLADFTAIHLERWQRFANQAQQEEHIAVFECAWLQNHVNELMMFHNKTQAEMLQHLQQLWDIVAPLNPLVIYLQPEDVTDSIAKVSAARVNKQGEPVWRDRVIEVVCQSPFGKAHQLQGMAGMTEYFRIRNQVELQMLKQLPAGARIFTRSGDDWQTLWQQVDTLLAGKFQPGDVHAFATNAFTPH